MSILQSIRPPTQSSSVIEVTKSQSLSLCKNLLKASVSEVCFLRNFFPSDCFKTVNFANTTVRSLDVSGVTDPACRKNLNQVIQWQESAAEALEMGYLRAMVLSIYTAEDNPQDRSIIETYVFSFKLPEDGPPSLQLELSGGAISSSIYSLETVRNSAVSLVRTLIRVAETMQPLPENRILDVHLFYHTHTPEDWQPSSGAFTDSTEEAPIVFTGGAPYKINLGSVASRHHSLSLKVAYRSDMAALEEDEEDLNGEGKKQAAATTKTTTVPEASAIISLPAASESAVAVAIPSEVASEEAQHPQVHHQQFEGIDPDVLSLARSVILKKSKWTVKALHDAIEDHHDLSNEQARRILKQLVSEGILVTALNAFSLSDLGASKAEEARSLAAAASIEAASVPANMWILKAIVSLLTACSKSKNRINVKSTDLRAELGIDRFLCDSIIARLRAIDIISSSSQGRNEVLWKDGSQKILNDAIDQLRLLEQSRPSSLSQRGRTTNSESQQQQQQQIEPLAQSETLRESTPSPLDTTMPRMTTAKRGIRTSLAAVFDEDEQSSAPPLQSKRRKF